MTFKFNEFLQAIFFMDTINMGGVGGIVFS